MKLSLLTALSSVLAVSATSNASCSAAPDSTSFPSLGFEFDFHMYVPLNPVLNVGNGPWGTRSWISFTGGSWCSKWNNGTTGIIIPGGQDANIRTENGTGPTWLDTNYLLKTDDEDPAYILIRTSGWVTDKWRLFIKLETGDPRYYDLNFGMWAAALTGGINGSYVAYDAFKLT